MTGRKNDHAGALEFVRVWQSSETGKEASLRLGMPHVRCSCRAHYLRGLGVPLKRFSKMPMRIDVAALTAAALEALNKK